MTHDSDCPLAQPCSMSDDRHTGDSWCQDCGSSCACDIIAKVRADEKAKWTHVCPDNNCCHQPGD